MEAWWTKRRRHFDQGCSGRVSHISRSALQRLTDSQKNPKFETKIRENMREPVEDLIEREGTSLSKNRSYSESSSAYFSEANFSTKKCSRRILEAIALK